jgi:alpha-L-fucosidase
MRTTRITDSVLNPASRANPDLQWFGEARFGMFIHFSLASLFGEDLGYQYQCQIPYNRYEANVRRFNPAKFRASDWVDAAVAGGCRYITFTAKHVEGFCNWDTKTTDFKITRSPFRRDLVRELADECHRRKMPLCLYVNPDDWHSRFKPSLPGNWGDRNWRRKDDAFDWGKHIRYIEAQLTELLTGYGPVAGIWFDCTNHQEHHYRGERLYRLIKRLQPKCLVNDRAKFGDFITPEWQIAEDLDSGRCLIEQCISIVEEGWGWRKDNRYRSIPECIDLLARTAGAGSNLLLNVGPDPEGLIPSEQVERMLAIGDWLRVNGAAVYGTQPAKLAGLAEDMRVTRRGSDLYVILRRWPKVQHVKVPGVLSDPASVELLGGAGLTWKRTGDGLDVDGLPGLPADATAKVIHLRFAREPQFVLRPVPVETTHTVAVAPAGATRLPVELARMEGLAVKGWRHAVSTIRPPDAAFAQKPGDLPFDADQPYEDGPAAVGEMRAILNWRYSEQSCVWTVRVPKAMRVKVRVCLRCPKIVAGSAYEISCETKSLTSKVRGNGPMEKEVRMDWWKGYSYLPFVWEDAGVLDLPQGVHEVTMRPTHIVWGCNFANVAALELAVTEKGKRQ